MKEFYKIKIEDISDRAEGIGRINGKVCFVPHTLPGDEVEIEITQDKGSFYKGRLKEDNDNLCGGAPLLRMPYGDQLAWKEKHVRDCLERIAKIDNPKINDIVGMENPYHYRNKGEFKVNENLPQCNINCHDCPIQNEDAMKTVAAFRENPRKNAKELIVRTAEDGKQLSYTIQENGFELLYSGERVMEDSIGNIKIEVDPFSFYQVNSVQRVKLYDLVKQYIKTGDSMLDLYCGAGTIGLYCSDLCSRVIGVESLHEAVIQANRNAMINGNVNALFIEGKAEDVVAEKLQGVKADIIVVDPPRVGCKKSLLDTIAAIAPARIVYVSCDPSTLARDIRYLETLTTNSGEHYEFVEATPVDMFPHTVHVEVCCCLSLK